MNARHIFHAFFGKAARRAIWDYIQMVLLIQLILLAIAWSIDLASNFASIQRGAEENGQSVLQILLPYLGYRTADMVTRLLPMSVFFGVYLAEIFRRYRLETVALSAAGFGPYRLLASVLVFAALVGALQQKLEHHWRPAAVMAQVDLGFGSYAHRYQPKWYDDFVWYLNGDMSLRAKIHRAPEPAMKDILIFTGVQGDALDQIIAAQYAEPLGTDGTWILSDVEIWDATNKEDKPSLINKMELQLHVIPEQISYRGINGIYLPDAALARLSRVTNHDWAANHANVTIWRRRSAWALPGAFAILAALFAQFGFAGRQPLIARMIALGAFGYICVVSIKVLWEIGILGGMPAYLAVLASIFGALLISAFAFKKLA